jgi:hypothetical protein
MHEITKNSGLAPGICEPCLECGKLVNVATHFAVEVAGSDDGREGYLHPTCRKTWQEKHPVFRYMNL